MSKHLIFSLFFLSRFKCNLFESHHNFNLLIAILDLFGVHCFKSVNFVCIVFSLRFRAFKYQPYYVYSKVKRISSFDNRCHCVCEKVKREPKSGKNVKRHANGLRIRLFYRCVFTYLRLIRRPSIFRKKRHHRVE